MWTFPTPGPSLAIVKSIAEGEKKILSVIASHMLGQKQVAIHNFGFSFGTEFTEINLEVLIIGLLG